MVQTEAQYKFVYMAVQHHIDTVQQRLQVSLKPLVSCCCVKVDKTHNLSIQCKGEGRKVVFTRHTPCMVATRKD